LISTKKKKVSSSDLNRSPSTSDDSNQDSSGKVSNQHQFPPTASSRSFQKSEVSSGRPSRVKKVPKRLIEEIKSVEEHQNKD
jgi:hypothetical protein